MKTKSMIALAVALTVSSARAEVFIGHLVDFSGPSAFVGKYYGSGVADSLKYIVEQGGPVADMIRYETVDYAYEIPKAIEQYQQWRTDDDLVALQGWGTGDTEALIEFVARDQVPVFSASYSGYLTDPTGKNPSTKAAAPYNFFYGPSYSDGCRALVQWAKEDWQQSGKSGKAKFIHLGDQHPYPESPRRACAEYAAEIGLEVLSPMVVSRADGDFTAQCMQLKEKAADYAFIANNGHGVASFLKSCAAVESEVKFIANIWAGDKPTMEAAGDGVEYYFVSATPFWGDRAPGMKLVAEIAGGDEFRTHHYIRGVCSTFYMAEAMEWALENTGDISGAAIKQGMYARTDWVPKGLEGVCAPSTWTAEDHRGTTTVNVYHGINRGGSVAITRVYQTTLPRRDDWLGY